MGCKVENKAGQDLDALELARKARNRRKREDKRDALGLGGLVAVTNTILTGLARMTRKERRLAKHQAAVVDVLTRRAARRG